MFFKSLSKCLLGLILMSTPAFSAEVVTDGELKALQQKMKSASQLSVDFTQIKTSTLRPNKPSRSSGHAVFAKPTKVRWELIKPAGETLIYDGATLYSLNTKEKIATKYGSSAEKALEINEIIGVVLDFDSMLQKYTVTQRTKDGTALLLTLKPNATSSTIEKIEARIDGATASIQGVKLIFSNRDPKETKRNTSEFTFSNPDRRVVPVKTFDVPKEYKVVEGL